MIRKSRSGWATVTVLAGLVVSGCAQEGKDERAPAPSEAPASPRGPEARAPEAEAQAPLGDYEPILGGALELRPATTWKRSAQGGFDVMASPNGQARILTAPLAPGDKPEAKRDSALEALGATEVRTAEEREIRVGEGQLQAKARDGSCRLPSGEAGFQYAVIEAGRGGRMFVLFAFDKTASEATRSSGMSVIASLRAKP